MTMKTINQRFENQRTDEDHPAWKGDAASYFSKHRWLYARVGKPKECCHCHAKAEERTIQWANVSGEYRRDITDYIPLCVPCHKTYDRQKRYGNFCRFGHEMTFKNTGHGAKRKEGGFYKICLTCHREEQRIYRRKLMLRKGQG